MESSCCSDGAVPGNVFNEEKERSGSDFRLLLFDHFITVEVYLYNAM